MGTLCRNLLNCCEKGDLPLIIELLEEGASVDWMDELGRTPLQVCAASGNEAAITILLQHGADVNFTNAMGWTAVMQSARNGHSATVKQLVRVGADLVLCNSFGFNVFAMAVASKDKETINALLPHADNSLLAESLAMAAQLGDTNTLQLLLEKRVGTNVALSNSGMTPLMLASCVGFSSVVEVLLSHEADPDITNALHMTALDIAISCGHVDIIALLAPVTNLRSRISAHIPLPATNISIHVSLPKTSHVVNPCTHKCLMKNQNLPLLTSQNSLACQCASSQSLGGCSPACSPCCHYSPHLPCSPLSPYSSRPVHPVQPQFCQQLSPHSHHSSQNCQNFPMQSSTLHSYQVDFPPTSPFYFPRECVEFPSSPVIPSWIFPTSPQASDKAKLQHHEVLKCEKRIRKWWKQMKKRCKVKRLPLNVTSLNEKDTALQCDQLEDLLLAMKLEKYLPVLHAHEVDVETFLSLREVDLAELGITDKATCRMILEKIRTMTQKDFRSPVY